MSPVIVELLSAVFWGDLKCIIEGKKSSNQTCPLSWSCFCPEQSSVPMNLNSILQNFKHICNMKPQKPSSHQSVFVSAATLLNPWDRLSSSLISKEAVQPHLFPFSITDFGWNQSLMQLTLKTMFNECKLIPLKTADDQMVWDKLNGFVPSVMLNMKSFAGWWKQDTTSMSENKIRVKNLERWEVTEYKYVVFVL